MRKESCLEKKSEGEVLELGNRSEIVAQTLTLRSSLWLALCFALLLSVT